MTESDFCALTAQIIGEGREGMSLPGPDTDLWHAGYLDSLRLLELLVRLEESHDIYVPADGSVEFRTIRSLWRGVSRASTGDMA